jgi:glutamine amidotransferase
MGYLSNDPTRLRCSLYPLRDQLLVTASDPHDGYGVGYFQTGEILLRKRPRSGNEDFRVVELTKDIFTDALVAHVRDTPPPVWEHENTQPFRYRTWLFAHRGEIPGFEQVRDEAAAQIPDFLRRNIRGDTDSEYLFHLFLSRLRDKGRLDDPTVDVRFAAGCLSATIAFVDALVEKAGGALAAARVNAIVSNGRVMAVTRRGPPVYYYRREGMADCQVCAQATTIIQGRPPRVPHNLLRYVVVASEMASPTEDWTEVPDTSMLTVNRNLEVAVAPLLL